MAGLADFRSIGLQRTGHLDSAHIAAMIDNVEAPGVAVNVPQRSNDRGEWPVSGIGVGIHGFDLGFYSLIYSLIRMLAN